MGLPSDAVYYSQRLCQLGIFSILFYYLTNVLQVYMSSSGLDWRPVLEAWLKTRSQREVTVFQQLFEDSFATMYSWGTQNLILTMNVLQCNIVQQVTAAFQS